jgi:predicted enzyme related to lactoylglutathione lyase
MVALDDEACDLPSPRFAGAVGIVPDMPVAESEHGLRPIRRRVRQQRLALPGHLILQLSDQQATPTANIIVGPFTDKEKSMEWKLELVAIPVSDVDRAKAFYTERAGFHADHDHKVNEDLRFVQLTPPGSACSIVLGTGITESTPGQAQAQLVVADIEAARKELVDRGVEVTEIQDLDWGSFVYFDDPDGNRWAVQQVTPRTAA